MWGVTISTSPIFLPNANRREKLRVIICLNIYHDAFVFLQGWQRKLDPEYDVLQTLQKLLFKDDWAESLFHTIGGLMAP